MRAIQKFLPLPRHVEIHRIYVVAKPKKAWEAARHFDGSSIPWVRMLFDLRNMPSKIMGQSLPETERSISIDQVVKGRTGFMILHEDAGKEVVIGSVGQFWHMNILFAHVQPNAFTKFDEHGWGKLAWAITVEPYLKGSTISFELRTTATDEDSWTRFSRYYHMIGIGSHLIRESVMAHLESQLGKMKLPDDDAKELPGDEIIPDAKYSVTHHQVIESPPSIVWRYLMQMGCDRAGWYSIDFLDHGRVPSVNHLVEEWDDRKAGDKIAATPAQNSFFDVFDVKKEKHLLIGGESEKMLGVMKPFKMTWSFVLEPIGNDSTHLVVRARMKTSPKWAEWIAGNVFYPPLHGLMSSVQLTTIKRYAERDAQMRVGEKKGFLHAFG